MLIQNWPSTAFKLWLEISSCGEKNTDWINVSSKTCENRSEIVQNGEQLVTCK